jgi:predicted nucleotidyltransferase
MILLPERIRRILERLVNELQNRGSVCGVGLFGSWSRGDATASSDVDLFILSRGDLVYEYVERLEVRDMLVDLDFVPRKWFHDQIPPDTDQKLREMQILYDRDWLLTNTKLLMVKSYGSAERVDIRTEDHLLDSDVCLSRATSALSKDDFLSARVFAVLSLESILRILGEIAMEPFSNSHFIERTKHAAMALEMCETFQKYLEVSGLSKIDESRIRERLALFRAAWEEISVSASESLRDATSLHFKVKASLNYYLNPAFLKGVIMRAHSIIESGDSIEAAHYLSYILLDIVQNYVWLRSSSNVKIDYTTLIRALGRLEVGSRRNHGYIVDLLGLGGVGEAEAVEAVRVAREVGLRVRRGRKALIKNYLIKA